MTIQTFTRNSSSPEAPRVNTAPVPPALTLERKKDAPGDPTPENRSFWQRHADAGIRAACEALFPENALGAPDWRDTEMVRRMHVYLGELPGPQRRLLLMLFIAVELGCLLLCLSRFSRLPPLKRAARVRRWRASRLAPLKLIGDALKATTTIIYMSHPAALRFVGAYKTCERPNDPLNFPVRPDALERMRLT